MRRRARREEAKNGPNRPAANEPSRADPSRYLAGLPIGARRDLLRVLTSTSRVRADLIRQMHERAGTRELAEVLIDLEADQLIRLQVIALLEQST